jgi:hypothetical protein
MSVTAPGRSSCWVAHGAWLTGAALLGTLACSANVELSTSATESFAGEAPAPPAAVSSVPTNVPFFGCPGYTPPEVGSSCNVFPAIDSSGTCEYGHDLEPACNDLFKCLGQWTREPRSSCFGRCPDSFQEIVAGAPCGDTAVGCSYLEGTCACVADDGSTPSDAGTGDGGATSQTTPKGHWRCAPPPARTCPAQRPAVGSDCVHPMTCDYGSCILGRPAAFSCEGSVWVRTVGPRCGP